MSTVRGEPVVVFIDPTTNPQYVHEFVQRFWEGWNLRSVLLYSRDTSRLRIAQSDAVIGQAGVAARHRGDLEDLEGLAGHLGDRYVIHTVVPHCEAVVLPSARLGDLLGTNGVSEATARQFRDKYWLKSSLRNAPGGPRMNRSARVSTPEDVSSFVRRNDLTRFVLKPNDGSGNSRVAFFSHRSALEDVQSYFSANPGTDVLLEEFIPGDEFCVNGQVDAGGEITTYSVQRTEHRPANGYPNLAGGFRMLASHSPEFRSASRYAAQVLSLTGLHGSPFHMEIKIGPDGPCLIEVGARLGGGGIPWDTQLAHRGRVDLFLEAAREYTSLPGRPAQPDWSAYDSSAVLSILGVGLRDEHVVRLAGVTEVEQLPQFRYWVRAPELGQYVRRTQDLTSTPWQVTLSAGSHDEVDEAAHRVRELITWNSAGSPVLRVPREFRARAAWLRRRSPMLAPLLAPGPSVLSAARLRRQGTAGEELPHLLSGADAGPGLTESQ